jgi:rhamnosyl/mannosyltransferase
MVDCIAVSTPNLIEGSEFLPKYRDRCEVISHGVNLKWVSESQPRQSRVTEIRRQYGTPLLLFVGRLVYYKGLEVLLEALSLVPNVRLLVIGAGPLDSSLRDSIARRGLEGRATILPPVTQQDLHAYYEACDLLVLPSTEKSETYGLVQIEAMACGKPVISTRLGTGVTFVNLDGVTGLTVPPRDPRALADAVEKLVKDPGLCRALGSNGRDRALKEFSSELMVDRMSSLYERLLKKERARV